MRKVVVVATLVLCALFPGKVDAQLNKNYIFYLGASFMNDSKYEDAIEIINILLRVDPELHEAYFLRGVAKYNLDDLLGAEFDFSTTVEKNPVYTQAYLYRAIARARLGNYDDALQDFQDAIDLRPDRAGPYYSRGVTYLLSQQFEKAVDDLSQYIKMESRVVDAYINRGISYLYLKDTVRAYEDFNRAIKTNREDPSGYNRRGSLYMTEKKYDLALADFNKAIECDSTMVDPYFNRALVYSHTNKPMQSLADFDRVLALDSTNSLTYFNRALVRSQIGDYNRALDDYNKVARYSPNNVLVYYNRAALYAHLGDFPAAEQDYSKAIELYPDFANAYLNRANIRYYMRDTKGSRSDRTVAERKIAEYRSKLTDSTFSIYADTSRRFNQLLSFDTRMSGPRTGFERVADRGDEVRMMPLFRFSLVMPEYSTTFDPQRYYVQRLEDFKKEFDTPYLQLTTRDSDIPPDSLVAFDRRAADESSAGGKWQSLFMRAITQSLIKQYTNSVNIYNEAIDKNPTNPFLYLNRSSTRSEMTDFISSIDNSYQRITIESDPSSRLKSTSTRIYSYDEAISDLNKAAKLLPEFAHIYYNRGNLQALSGRLPEAYDDYTKAIELWPNFPEAYFNRGLVQIYLKDTRKGLLDISKAGELGIKDAYAVLKRYANTGEE